MKNKCLFIIAMLFCSIFLQGMLLRRLRSSGKPTLPARRPISRSFSTVPEKEVPASSPIDTPPSSISPQTSFYKSPFTPPSLPKTSQEAISMPLESAPQDIDLKVETPSEQKDPAIIKMKDLYNQIISLSPKKNALESFEALLEYGKAVQTKKGIDINEQELYKILNSLFVAMYKTVLKDTRTLNNIKSLDLILIDYLKNFPLDTQIKIDTVKRLRPLTHKKYSYIVKQKNKELEQPKEETIIPKAPATKKPELTWSEKAKQLWNSWFGNSAPSPITTSQRDPFKEGQARPYHSIPTTQQKSSLRNRLTGMFQSRAAKEAQQREEMAKEILNTGKGILFKQSYEKLTPIIKLEKDFKTYLIEQLDFIQHIGSHFSQSTLARLSLDQALTQAIKLAAYETKNLKDIETLLDSIILFLDNYKPDINSNDRAEENMHTINMGIIKGVLNSFGSPYSSRSLIGKLLEENLEKETQGKTLTDIEQKQLESSLLNKIPSSISMIETRLKNLETTGGKSDIAISELKK